MRVVQVEKATHAVLGGGAVRRVQLEESPEFFKMAIDAYQDKPLAVVREILCNAWDEHVKAGMAHVPIEVTLTEDDLIIRDYGPGIADHDMEAVFCRIGKSTKQDEEDQTGGFGIGAMAPLTYSPWFNVTSHHCGKARQYVVSLGSEETLGFPELRNMVETPTDEHGLEIQVPLKTPRDRRTFHEHVLAVVRNGSMNVKLNDKTLPSWDYGEGEKTGYVLYPRASTLEIMVKVGAVLYPLNLEIPEIKVEREAIKDQMDNFTGMLILMAEPSRVAITPSRESLSYTSDTTKYLVRLLRHFRADMNRLRGYALDRCADHLSNGVILTTIRQQRLPDFTDDVPELVTTPEDVAYIWHRTLLDMGSNSHLIIRRLVKRWLKKAPWLNHLDLPYNADLHDLAEQAGEFTRYALAKTMLKSGMDFRLYAVGGYVFMAIQKEFKGRLAPTKLFVAERQKDIKDAHDLKHETRRTMVGAALIPKLDEDKVVRLMELFEPLGIEIEWCMRSKVKPKPKVEREPTQLKIVSGLVRSDGYGSSAKYRGKKSEAEDFDVYLPVRNLQGGAKIVDDALRSHWDSVSDVMPKDFALVSTKTEHKIAAERGAVNASTYLLREIKAAARTVDFKLGYLITRGNPRRWHGNTAAIRTWYRYSPASLIKVLGLRGRSKGDLHLFALGRLAYDWAEKSKEAGVATLLEELPTTRMEELTKKAGEAPGFDLLEGMSNTDESIREQVVRLVLRNNDEWIKKGDLSCSSE